MAAFRGTFIFELGSSGWSETWYRTDSTIEGAHKAFVDLAPYRAKLLGKYAFISAIRTSDDGLFGESLLTEGLDLPTAALEADFPNNAVQVRVEATSLYRRTMWLRGMPDDWVKRSTSTAVPATTGTFYPFHPDLLDALDTFALQLSSRFIALKVGSKEGTGSLLGADLIGTPTEDLASGKNWTVLNNAGPSDAEVGEYVLIARGRGPDRAKWNRRRRVVRNTGGNVVINYKWADFEELDLTGYGLLMTRHVAYPTITNTVPIRVSTRQTGRVFFVPRGRAKSRCISP